MKELRRRGVVGALALLLDMLLQELPARWSPAAMATIGVVLGRAARRMPKIFGVWGEAALLSTTLGMNNLRRQTTGVGRQLIQADLPAARTEAARLLGRSTAEMDAGDLASATIGAAADGTSEQVVAPMVYYVLAGLPGAMLYRMILEMQDSLGRYRDAILAYVRLLPSRVTGGLLVGASYLVGENGARAWRICQRDAVKATVEPYTYTRGAMAGALGVEIEDDEAVAVGMGERQPDGVDVLRAVRLMRTAVALGAGLLIGLPLLGRMRK